MSLLRDIARRSHPLHRLRKTSLFRAATRRCDPIVRCRSPLLAGPIYLRLLANASLIVDPLGQEPEVRETFATLLRALPQTGGVFWDIGANVGLFTWYCATLRPDIAIISFEPDRKNLACLRRTQGAWKRERHEIMPCAVSDQSGRATFHLDEISGATGTLEVGQGTFNKVQYGAPGPTIEVETVAIDDVIAGGHAAPSLIKIDVEQAELRVLRGGEKLLRVAQPILLLETCGERSGTYSFLKDCGYELFDSDHRTAVTPESINVLALPAAVDSSISGVLAAIGYPVGIATK